MIKLKDIDPRMIANNLVPSKPIHPGEMLKEEIEYRGISQKKLAELTGISYTVVNEVLNGKRAVTTKYALLFEAALGIEATIWLRTQSDYSMQMRRNDKVFSKRLEKIRQLASML